MIKAPFLLLLTSVLCHDACSQTSDTTLSSFRNFLVPSTPASDTSFATMSYSTQAQKKIFVTGNEVVVTYHAIPTPLEREITHLEYQESEAVKKRDTTTLRKLWARDFTLDSRPSGIVYGKNDLPNYLGYGRMVETITPLDANTVYTSGYEYVREIKNNGKIEDSKRKFFHTWTRKNLQWKLTTKTND